MICIRLSLCLLNAWSTVCVYWLRLVCHLARGSVPLRADTEISEALCPFECFISSACPWIQTWALSCCFRTCLPAAIPPCCDGDTLISLWNHSPNKVFLRQLTLPMMLYHSNRKVKKQIQLVLCMISKLEIEGWMIAFHRSYILSDKGSICKDNNIQTTLFNILVKITSC